MDTVKRIGSILAILIAALIVGNVIAALIMIPAILLLPTLDGQVLRITAAIVGFVGAIYLVRKEMRKGRFGDYWKAND